MSTLKICGQELELDLFDVDVMEVYEKSKERTLKRFGEIDKCEGMSNADGMREMCKSIKAFFDELFGEGTAEKLFEGKNNFEVCMDAFAAVASEEGKMVGRLNAIANKYSLNRAQRRQENKKKHSKSM